MTLREPRPEFYYECDWNGARISVILVWKIILKELLKHLYSIPHR